LSLIELFFGIMKATNANDFPFGLAAEPIRRLPMSEGAAE
jgi:hypothetical protein